MIEEFVTSNKVFTPKNISYSIKKLIFLFVDKTKISSID